MKLILDMNLPPRLAAMLSNDEIEAVHWSALGKCDATDVEIMKYAEETGYIVVTMDLDFSAILASTQRYRPSVIQIRAENASPDDLCKPLLNALRQMKSELDAGALLTIDLDRTRLRLLPL